LIGPFAQRFFMSAGAGLDAGLLSRPAFFGSLMPIMGGISALFL